MKKRQLLRLDGAILVIRNRTALEALGRIPPEAGGTTAVSVPLVSFPKENQRPKSSRRRLVCARLTGISVCFLSSMRS
jgi:hypothetical protein